jgi:putative endonuclease
MFLVKTIEGNSKIGNETGRLGEEIASRFVVTKGFKIIERNYRQKWGEIDIVAEFNNELHFIEVKSVSRESEKDVTRETKGDFFPKDTYRAEDNIHPTKLKRLSRTIQSYLASEGKYSSENWHFDAITVIMNGVSKKAYVTMIGDLIL